MLREVSGFVNYFFVLKVYFSAFVWLTSSRLSVRPSCLTCVKVRGRLSSCMMTQGAVLELLHL